MCHIAWNWFESRIAMSANVSKSLFKIASFIALILLGTMLPALNLISSLVSTLLAIPMLLDTSFLLSLTTHMITRIEGQ